jgi:hypothetical protein
MKGKRQYVQATLDESARSRVQLNKPILLVESHKLDPWPLDEGRRPKSGKSRLNLHGTILEGKWIGSDQKKELIQVLVIYLFIYFSNPTHKTKIGTANRWGDYE